MRAKQVNIVEVEVETRHLLGELKARMKSVCLVGEDHFIRDGKWGSWEHQGGHNNDVEWKEYGEASKEDIEAFNALTIIVDYINRREEENRY